MILVVGTCRDNATGGEAFRRSTYDSNHLVQHLEDLKVLDIERMSSGELRLKCWSAAWSDVAMLQHEFRFLKFCRLRRSPPFSTHHSTYMKAFTNLQLFVLAMMLCILIKLEEMLIILLIYLRRQRYHYQSHHNAEHHMFISTLTLSLVYSCGSFSSIDLENRIYLRWPCIAVEWLVVNIST